MINYEKEDKFGNIFLDRSKINIKYNIDGRDINVNNCCFSAFDDSMVFL